MCIWLENSDIRFEVGGLDNSLKQSNNTGEIIFKFCSEKYSTYRKIRLRKFENVYFNGTGGLASTAVILSQEILKRNGKFLAYDIFDNGFNIVTQNSLEKKQINKNQDIFTHLILKGYEPSEYG